MTREELVIRLKVIKTVGYLAGVDYVLQGIHKLIEDIEEDGVLDVQAPPELHQELNLPSYVKKIG